MYGELTALGETLVAGSPAELVGRRERIVLLNATGGDEVGRRRAARCRRSRRALPDRSGHVRVLSGSLCQPHTPPGGDQPPTLGSCSGGRSVVAALAAAVCGRAARPPASPRSRRSGAAHPRHGRPGWSRRRLDDICRSLVAEPRSSAGAGRSVRAPFLGQSGRRRRSGDENLPGNGPAVDHPRCACESGCRTGDFDFATELLAAGFGVMLLAITAAGYFVFRAVRRETRVSHGSNRTSWPRSLTNSGRR